MKRNSRSIALLLSAAILASLVSACGGGSTPTPTPAPAAESQPAVSEPAVESAEPAPANYLDQEPLRIGIMPHQMGVSIYYADKYGLFEEAGINVDVAIFGGGAAINEAFGAGALDGAISGLASVYSLANKLVTMVGEVDTVGSDCLVVRNDSDILSVQGEIPEHPEMYGSAETLRGKSFIAQLGQSHQFYVLKYISQFGLTEDDITFINMEDTAGPQAYANGNGDVLGTKMPYCYDLCVTDGGYTIAATVADATGIEIKDPILFTPETIANRREEVKIFLQVVYGLIDKWGADYDAYKEAVREYYEENGREFDDAKIDYEFSQNRLLTSSVISGSDYFMGDGMQAVADFYGTTGAIAPENVDNVYKSYDTSLLEEALGIKVQAFSKD